MGEAGAEHVWLASTVERVGRAVGEVVAIHAVSARVAVTAALVARATSAA